jgi:flavin reductase (DIM6/NTAB) family NADH-FMN oxidoreductase RutF
VAVTLAHASEANLTDRYRVAMRNVAAAVAVVTTFDPDGRPHGTTVSAFTPLSMDPPLLLVSLDNTSRLLALVVTGRSLGVNVLAADQSDLGRQFSQRTGDRWLGVPWRVEADAPALVERHAYIGIAVEQQIAAGDHTLVVGSVTTADWDVGEPLTYWQREFGTYQRV